MSNPFDGRDERALRVVVRDGLAARDRSMRPPGFASVWPHATRPSASSWRPAFAAFGAVVMLAGGAWVLLSRQGADPTPAAELRVATELARQLSSPDYWRVPTDDLLAFAAPPLSAELPLPEGFHVSLEESLL